MNKIIQFLKESVEELKYKVSWPKYGELQNNTIMVIIASVIFALVIFGIDFVFDKGMTEIYSSF